LCRAVATKKMTSAPAAKYIVKQKKERLRANGERKPTNGSKPKVTAKTKPKPKPKKEVLAKKDDEKGVGAAITPEKLEEVGSSTAMRRR